MAAMAVELPSLLRLRRRSTDVGLPFDMHLSFDGILSHGIQDGLEAYVEY